MAHSTRPLHEFGQIISGNRGKNNELSESTRTAILTAVRCGKTKSEVISIFNVLCQTVFNTVQCFNQTNIL